jgi:D-alanyl-D-alanine carboxypeptidase/D-alanyl-D-alanine-endopeptidase (penicillin-binding protein 4)
MMKKVLIISLLSLKLSAFSQEEAFKSFMADSVMEHAAVSLLIMESDSGRTVFEYNAARSLIPASVMKLVTTASALELLGPEHTFKTSMGYTGKITRLFKILDGDIIIKGGGDPALGSENFEEHYAGFTDKWVEEFKKLKIKEVSGSIITDDSYFDYLPVPAKWLWEDAGNYYGAGAYGLSLFDNTYEIHLSISADSSQLLITGITPAECRFEFSNWLVAAGTADEGYVFAAPYSTNGWLAGTIPSNLKDFVLKASIADPPIIMAKLMEQKIRDAGITVKGSPSTVRLLQSPVKGEVINLTETESPPLARIIEVLNHESVNLYAEHLVKEIGKVCRESGSTEKGIQCINEFLTLSGINTDGLFMEDGSGLSPLNAINAQGMVSLLHFMKTRGKHFNEFYASLPEAGKEGTLKNRFTDQVFESNLRAKSGSMTRVRSYAGYFTAKSGREMIFCIIVNNFEGTHSRIISHIEEILKETILTN